MNRGTIAELVTVVAFCAVCLRSAELNSAYAQEPKLRATVSAGEFQRVKSLAFSGDGKVLAGAQGKVITLWDAVTGQRKAALEGHESELFAVAFSSDSKSVASCTLGEIRLWDATAVKKGATLKTESAFFTCLAFSGDNKLLGSGSADSTVHIWDVATRKIVATMKHPDGVNSVAFGTGILASVGGDRMVKLWDIAGGKLKATLEGHTSEVTAVAFNRDRTLLASGSRDKTVKIWDVATGKEQMTINDSATVRAVGFAGNRIAFGGDGKVVKLWDFSSGKEIASLPGHKEEVSCIAVSPDGRLLASGSTDWTIKLWEIPAPSGK
jgi:WD40 repeat protein